MRFQTSCNRRRAGAKNSKIETDPPSLTPRQLTAIVRAPDAKDDVCLADELFNPSARDAVPSSDASVLHAYERDESDLAASSDTSDSSWTLSACPKKGRVHSKRVKPHLLTVTDYRKMKNSVHPRMSRQSQKTRARGKKREEVSSVLKHAIHIVMNKSRCPAKRGEAACRGGEHVKGTGMNEDSAYRNVSFPLVETKEGIVPMEYIRSEIDMKHLVSRGYALVPFYQYTACSVLHVQAPPEHSAFSSQPGSSDAREWKRSFGEPAEREEKRGHTQFEATKDASSPSDETVGSSPPEVTGYDHAAFPHACSASRTHSVPFHAGTSVNSIYTHGSGFLPSNAPSVNPPSSVLFCYPRMCVNVPHTDGPCPMFVPVNMPYGDPVFHF